MEYNKTHVNKMPRKITRSKLIKNI